MSFQIPSVRSAAKHVESLAADGQMEEDIVSKATKPRKEDKEADGQVEDIVSKAKKARKEDKKDSDRYRFTPEEDLCLTKIFINQTVDCINGTDQKGKTFWNNIFKLFCIKWKEWGYQRSHNNLSAVQRKRTADSLDLRWRKTISPELQLFKAALGSAKKKYITGNIDLIQQALEIFKVRNGYDFKYMDCWDIAKQLPKYSDNGGDVKADDRKVESDEDSTLCSKLDTSIEAVSETNSISMIQDDGSIENEGVSSEVEMIDEKKTKFSAEIEKIEGVKKKSFSYDPTKNMNVPPGSKKAKRAEQEKKMMEKEKNLKQDFMSSMTNNSVQLVNAVNLIANNGAYFVRNAAMESDLAVAKEMIASSDPEDQALGRELRRKIARMKSALYDPEQKQPSLKEAIPVIKTDKEGEVVEIVEI